MKNKKKLLLIAGIIIFLALIACVVFYYQTKALSPVEAIMMMYNTSRVKYSGVVVDENGTPLKGVKVQISKTKITDILNSKAIGETENKEVNSKFSFSYIGYPLIEFFFSKEGYYPERIILNSLKQEGTKKYLAVSNARIVLRKAGPFEQMTGGRLDVEQYPDKKIGWRLYRAKIKIKCEDKEAENIVFIDPKNVDFYLEDRNTGRSLFMKGSDERSGFIKVENALDMTYLREAPENGYQNTIEITYNDGSKNPQFYYFRVYIDGNFYYGKVKVYGTGKRKDGRTYIDANYKLNIAHGSRNVSTESNL